VKIVDCGTGVPLVILPGLQGRWEWMAPAVDALSTCCRVITFSLCDEPSSGFALDPARGIENYLAQIEAALDHVGVEDVVLMGVSYAGPIATEFAVRRPHRVRALMLVSALPPDWTPDRRARFYLRAPRLLSPIFFVDAPLRAQRELRAALPRWSDRFRFAARQTATFCRCFLSPTRMATRIAWLGQFRFSDPSSLRVPALVVTGEPGLDRVVPPDLTCRYLRAMPRARHVVLPRTGHLGSCTRPREFAAIVREFLSESSSDVHRASA
jgi:pimeloyl-ACP methyl ester carboxylesterase